MATLQTYSQFSPSAYDRAGLALPDQQDWLVAPCTTNRDADALTRANWTAMLSALEEYPDTDWEQHSFGHWACGHFDIVIVRPETPAADAMTLLAEQLEDYPVVCEDTYSDEQFEEANTVWQDCYSDQDRIDYIRANRDQFAFRDMADLIAVVRGRYFTGYASELLD